VLATTATHARGATPAATMRYVLTTTATGTLAGIAAATMCHVLATVYCTITLATAAGINNPLTTAAAKIQPLFTAAAITKPLLDVSPAVPVIASYGIAATRSVYRDVVFVPIDVATPITA
jgi:hypothetical protein